MKTGKPVKFIRKQAKKGEFVDRKVAVTAADNLVLTTMRKIVALKKKASVGAIGSERETFEALNEAANLAKLVLKLFAPMPGRKK